MSWGPDKAVVGHSMGGIIAPDLLGAIVMRDAPMFVPPSEADALNLARFIAALRTPAYRDATRGFCNGTFLPTDHPGCRAHSFFSPSPYRDGRGHGRGRCPSRPVRARKGAACRHGTL